MPDASKEHVVVYEQRGHPDNNPVEMYRKRIEAMRKMGLNLPMAREVSVDAIEAEQVHRRLTEEARVDSTLDAVADWTHEQRAEVTQWLNALLRRKEGHPHKGDTYRWPECVSAMQIPA